MVQHDDALGQRHHGAHHVLDQEQGHPSLGVQAPQGRRPPRRSRSACSPAITSSSSSSGPGGERARDLQPLAVGKRQLAGAARPSASARPTRAQRASARARPRPRAWRPPRKRADHRVLDTVMPANGLTIWKVRPMPASQAIRAADRRSRGPRRRASRGRARSTPAMRLKSVVLPAPLGPISATISPRATGSERARRPSGRETASRPHRPRASPAFALVRPRAPARRRAAAGRSAAPGAATVARDEHDPGDSSTP